MKYDIKTPCENCPFRVSTHFSFPIERAGDILYNDGGFSCHKTSTQKGRGSDHPEVQACAGRLILLEREDIPDQMMRISERLGFYDRTMLDMNNPDVFEDIDSFLDARSE